MRATKLSLALLVPLAGAMTARAQSFNLDLDDGDNDYYSGGGAPSSGFGGAANQPGYWQALYAGGPTTPVTLLGLNGLQTSAQLVATGGTGLYGGSGYNINTGDYRLLLNDYAVIGGEIDYHFTGFRPGRYAIYTYAVESTGLRVDTVVTVPGAIVPVQHVTGPMPGNQFIQGVTHSIHDLTITGTSFEIDVTGPWPDSECNGFQIQSVPEPSGFWCFPIALGAILFRRGAGPSRHDDPCAGLQRLPQLRKLRTRLVKE